ncbi:MAG: toxin secretion, membrane fusion protein [Spirulina sp.]
MKVIYTKVQLKEQTSDFAYWQTQSYQARLRALEEIRQDYHRWKDNNAQPRFQSVYTVVKQ